MGCCQSQWPAARSGPQATVRTKTGGYGANQDLLIPRVATRKGVSSACLPCVMSTSGRIHGDFLRLLYITAHSRTERWFAQMAGDHHSRAPCPWRDVHLVSPSFGIPLLAPSCSLSPLSSALVSSRSSPTAARDCVRVYLIVGGFYSEVALQK